ncbi:MAG: hypothetical protein JO173_06155 [Gammaproteobacteria bacterium]|nr:hypothetical protein [Gammaproteobacteria bacterium]
MSRWLLALLVITAGAPLARAADAVAAIDACLGRLDATLDVGFARISARCPDLARDLGASPAADWLPADWTGSGLSAGGLRELRTLLTRPAAAALRAPPRPAAVAAVLAGIGFDPHRHLSTWERFKAWLREVLSQRPPPEERGWLRRLLGDLGMPQAMLDTIAWCALAAIAVLAVAIVANELRVAGLFARARRSAFASRDARGASSAPSVAALAGAALAEQPRLLLELIVARLRAQDRLPPARALTLHELARAARLPHAADHERLAALAVACERIRFAAGEVPATTLAAALTRGRELLAGLEPLPAG